MMHHLHASAPIANGEHLSHMTYATTCEKGRDALTGVAALVLSSPSNLVGGSTCGPPWLASDTERSTSLC
jgi:hypothetical protein